MPPLTIRIPGTRILPSKHNVPPPGSSKSRLAEVTELPRLVIRIPGRKTERPDDREKSPTRLVIKIPGRKRGPPDDCERSPTPKRTRTENQDAIMIVSEIHVSSLHTSNLLSGIRVCNLQSIMQILPWAHVGRMCFKGKLTSGCSRGMTQGTTSESRRRLATEVQKPKCVHCGVLIGLP